MERDTLNFVFVTVGIPCIVVAIMNILFIKGPCVRLTVPDSVRDKLNADGFENLTQLYNCFPQMFYTREHNLDDRICLQEMTDAKWREVFGRVPTPAVQCFRPIECFAPYCLTRDEFAMPVNRSEFNCILHSSTSQTTLLEYISKQENLFTAVRVIMNAGITLFCLLACRPCCASVTSRDTADDPRCAFAYVLVFSLAASLYITAVAVYCTFTNSNYDDFTDDFTNTPFNEVLTATRMSYSGNFSLICACVALLSLAELVMLSVYITRCGICFNDWRALKIRQERAKTRILATKQPLGLLQTAQTVCNHVSTDTQIDDSKPTGPTTDKIMSPLMAFDDRLIA